MTNLEKTLETTKGTLFFEKQTDYIDVYLDGSFIGRIFDNEGDWERVLEGENPLENDWEDGLGNSLSYEGWGKNF